MADLDVVVRKMKAWHAARRKRRKNRLKIEPRNLCEWLLCYGDDFDFRPRATKKTNAWPGTDQKIQVLIERVSRGEELFHRDDPRIYAGVIRARIIAMQDVEAAAEQEESAD